MCALGLDFEKSELDKCCVAHLLKRNKNYSSYSHTAYSYFKNSSSPHVQKGGLAKHQKPK
jgi:hypothetical protein